MYKPYFKEERKYLNYIVKGANDTYFEHNDKSTVKKLAWLIYAPSGIPYKIYDNSRGRGIGGGYVDYRDSYSAKEIEKAQKQVSKLPSYHPVFDLKFLKSWRDD